MDISDKLKQLRERRGLTVREAAKRAGIHWTLWNKYELGKARPSYDGLEKLVKAYNISLDDMFFKKI